MAFKRTISRLIRQIDPKLQLKKEDFFYFSYDTGSKVLTHQVQAYRINQLTIDQWLDEAQRALEEFRVGA